MNHKYLLPAAIMGTMLLAKCDCQHTCSIPNTELLFANFDSTDLHVVVVQEFAEDGKFDRPEDTIILSNNPAAGHDTSIISTGLAPIDSRADYIITVPSLSRTWKLTGISLHRDGNKETSNCTSGFTYFINDTINTVPMNMTSANLPAIITIVK